MSESPQARFYTAEEHFQWAANLWAVCRWRANSFDYDLFIDDQMNEGIDPNDGTSFREEVRV